MLSLSLSICLSLCFPPLSFSLYFSSFLISASPCFFQIFTYHSLSLSLSLCVYLCFPPLCVSLSLLLSLLLSLPLSHSPRHISLGLGDVNRIRNRSMKKRIREIAAAASSKRKQKHKRPRIENDASSWMKSNYLGCPVLSRIFYSCAVQCCFVFGLLSLNLFLRLIGFVMIKEQRFKSGLCLTE